MTRPATKPSRTLERLAAQLRGAVGKCIADYGMIQDGDKVMVCLSGGKDSYTLLDMLLSLQRSAPVSFELLAVNLDQKQPDFPAQVLPEYLAARGVPFHIIEQDTYSVVKRVIPQGRTMCGLCSRLRRGALYRFAAENGITKIALGHHREDIVETLFLNLFFGGRLKAMAPKLLSDDARHVVIRPLAYVAERDIARYARGRDFPIIPCKLCGSQDNMQRMAIKKMLAEWEREFPGRTESIFSALRNIEPAHLADPAQFDFAGLDLRRVPAMSDAEESAFEERLALSPGARLTGPAGGRPILRHGPGAAAGKLLLGAAAAAAGRGAPGRGQRERHAGAPGQPRRRRHRRLRRPYPRRGVRFLPGPAAARARPYLRHPIPDHGLPRDAAQMAAILADIRAQLAAGRCVYLHCRAGIGRTGMTAGCLLAESHGGEAAIEELNHLWQMSARAASWPSIPETDAQTQFVRDLAGQGGRGRPAALPGDPGRRARPARALPRGAGGRRRRRCGRRGDPVPPPGQVHARGRHARRRPLRAAARGLQR